MIDVRSGVVRTHTHTHTYTYTMWLISGVCVCFIFYFNSWPLTIIGSSVSHNVSEVDGSFCLPACWYREQGLSYFTVWWIIIGNSVSHNVVHIICMDSAGSLLKISCVCQLLVLSFISLSRERNVATNRINPSGKL